MLREPLRKFRMVFQKDLFLLGRHFPPHGPPYFPPLAIAGIAGARGRSGRLSPPGEGTEKDNACYEIYLGNGIHNLL